MVGVARDLSARLGRARSLGIAAEMSFWLFLALVPLATVAGWGAARLAVQRPAATYDLLAPIPSVAREVVANEVAKIAAWNGQSVAPTAVVVFLWLASTGVHAIFDAMELEAGGQRPWWRKRLIALGTCIVLSFGIALSALLVTGLSWIWSVTGATVPSVAAALSWGPAWQACRAIAGALLAIGMVSALFVIGVPPAARRGMPTLPGALMVVALGPVLGYGYGIYISKMGTGSAYLAGIAGIGVTMTALYLASVALLVGLEVNVMIRDRRRSSRARESVEVPSEVPG